MYEVGTKLIRIQTGQRYVIEKVTSEKVSGKLFKKETKYHLKQERGPIDLIVHEDELKSLFKCVKPTNADRIRSMSDEELARLLKDVKTDYQWSNPDYPSEDDFCAWLEWLQSEVEE